MKLRILPLSLVLAGVFLLTGCREKIMPPQVAQIIRSTVESETLPVSIKEQKERARAWDEMRRFYQKRQYQPAWSEVGGPRPHAEQLVETLGSITTAEGLDPRRYHSTRLAGLLSQVKEQESLESPEAQRRLADLDVELTFVYLTLAAHTAIGRVQPETLRVHWEDQSRNVDLDARLETTLQDKDGAVMESLRSLAPPNPRYARLRDALARYREIAAKGGWPSVPAGLEMGARGAGVLALRNRLAAEGDLAVPPAEEGQPAPPPVFDDAVAQAIARFQQRHGLDPDGKLGEGTLAELNVPVQDRIRQIELNLERWRWLPNSLGDSYIWVNVPEYRMELIDGGRKALDMAVVVGKQQSQTPVFSDQMEYLELNPAWNIPTSIAEEEILPKQASDPGYMARNNMEFVSSGGSQRIRQRPGPDNPLGQVKFMFPNEHDVYLHDSPADHLFSREERDFSHGCVRLERPVQLAEYLLRDNPDWRGTRLREAIVSGEQRSIKLPKKLPVHILYFTAWVEDNGAIHFRKDVYGHDAKLAAALAQEPVVPLDLPALRGDVRAAVSSP
ncbi:MAG TPA: L,D-transpeptidase family protein [Thermoanaerobaculia bacterium]|nr:L,D-transpeptidase family protein [Thermoanaerobaculia bacterium]